MKNVEVTIFDLFAYIIPGLVLILEILFPLHLLELIKITSLSLGDTAIVTALSLFGGILCSAFRPRRFEKSITGTTESAYANTLKDNEIHKAVTDAIQYFFGDSLTLENWTPIKHFTVRFFVERNDNSAGKFIRRQSAIRQLRYNSVFPAALLIIISPVVGYTGVVISLWPWQTALPLTIAAIMSSALALRAIFMSAHGNIVREVNYVFTALLSLYCEKKFAMKDKRQDGDN